MCDKEYYEDKTFHTQVKKSPRIKTRNIFSYYTDGHTASWCGRCFPLVCRLLWRTHRSLPDKRRRFDHNLYFLLFSRLRLLTSMMKSPIGPIWNFIKRNPSKNCVLSIKTFKIRKNLNEGKSPKIFSFWPLPLHLSREKRYSKSFSTW